MAVRQRVLLILVLLATASVVPAELSRRPRPWLGHASKRHAPLPRAPAVDVPAYFTAWRQAYLRANETSDVSGLVRGIFLGEDSAVAPPVRELFRDAGLSHLLAASGYNCWIVALAFGLALQLAARACAGQLPARISLQARRTAAPLSRLAGAWLFWLWTDQSPPITRSALMITAKSALDAAGIAVPLWRLLLGQYLVSLTVAPALWHSASFQLTYGCLFGILSVPRLFARFRPETGLLSGAPWDYFFTSLGAVTGCLPACWIAFGEVNFTSITTNWFAVPPVSFAIMPLALAQMLLLAPGLGVEHTRLGLLATHALGGAASEAATLLHRALAAWMSVAPSLRWHP
ncbi:MAG: ComEC/Rec2 family competence protein [Deltaproteobacteria bacterium]|nr:ComEC/Rec2 family competence protein [Deltaproteobacteria bacterium]